MFSERYKKDNERVTAKYRTLDELRQEAANGALRTRSAKVTRYAVCAAAILVVVALGGVLLAGGNIPFLRTDKATPAVVDPPEALTAGSYDEIFEHVARSMGGMGGMGVDTGTNMTFPETSDDAEMFVAEETDGEITGAPAADSFDSVKETAPTTTAATANINSAANEGGKDYSETNVQVKGVDEGDVVKTDGEYLYISRNNGGVSIVNASSMTELSRVDPPEAYYASTQDLYISGDRLAVIYNTDSYTKWFVNNPDSKVGFDGDYRSATVICVYDLSDRTAPKLTATLEQDGWYNTSRLSDGVLYTISNYFVSTTPVEDKPDTFVPVTVCNGTKNVMSPEAVCLFDDETNASAAYTVITSVGLEKGEQFDDARAAFGTSGSIYCNGHSLLISAYRYDESEEEATLDGQNVIIDKWSNSTDFLLFTLDGGKITSAATGNTPGSLLNQFSMDEYNGYFRVVTTVDDQTTYIYTDGRDRYEYEGHSANALYVLDSKLNRVGSIEDLAEGETVYSVRFDGSIGYFVTFRQVDPLFAVDLSDPTSPKILSELKIPGFSRYLHPYADGLLLGLGNDADIESGSSDCLKLSMFDTSDPTNVTEKSKLLLDDWYWSEALYDHKAALISAERNIIAFPVDSSVFVVYGYDPQTGFTKRAQLELSDKWYGFIRGMYIDNDMYICTAAAVDRFDMTTFARTASLTLSELPESNIEYSVTNSSAVEDVIEE